MEDIFKFEISKDKIQAAVEISVDNILKSSYGNPFKDCIEKALKEKENAVSKCVSDIITETLNREDFKTKLGEILMNRMVESAIKK